MLYVYATPARRARCLSRDDKAPQPLVLVRAFSDEEHEAAWHLLLELGGQPTAA